VGETPWRFKSSHPHSQSRPFWFSIGAQTIRGSPIASRLHRRFKGRGDVCFLRSHHPRASGERRSVRSGSFRRDLKASDGIFVYKELHAWKFVSGRGRVGDRVVTKYRRGEIFRDTLELVASLPGVRLLNGGAAAEPEPGSAPRCCTRRATGRGSRLDCRHGPSATSVLAGSATRNGHTGRCRTRPAAPSDDAKPCASSRSRASSFSSAGKPSRGDFRRQGLRYALSLMRPAFGLVTMDAEGGG
jgi:hypothetical protein